MGKTSPSTIENTSDKIKDSAKKVFKRDSAYNQMTDKIPTMHAKQTIADARDLLFEKIKDFDSINYIYILSKSNRLVGVVSLKDLFRRESGTTLSKIMNREVSKVRLHTDRERVAHQALRENIKALPVVDDDNVFQGVVVSDKILHILQDETQEDLLRLGGIIPIRSGISETMGGPVIKSFLQRIPWIVIGAVGGVVSASVIGRFESTLETNLILAFFIPLVVYISDAVGTQTQTIMVRDMATLKKIPIASYVIKQSIVSSLIGLVCAVLIYFAVLLFWGEGFIGFVIGTASFISVSFSAAVAILIPFALGKFDQDPAIGSGPFATIIQDVISIVVYFMTSYYLLAR